MQQEKSVRLANTVKEFAGKHIAVIGDLMLDTYTWGKVSRISPEAPVPIVHTVKTTCCPGGAANVMQNLITLGAKSSAFGIIGGDHTGIQLKDILLSDGITCDGIVTDSSRPTVKKQRVMAGSQQLLRIDEELTTPITENIRKELLEKLNILFENDPPEALILEDYAKGLFTQDFAQEILDLANSRNIPVSLDPNPRNPMRLKGLTIMKPNRNEAYELAGMKNSGEGFNEKELLEVAGKIRNEWQVKYLLISLAEQGMALFTPDGKMTHIPTRAKEVFDVCGAGDTVITTSTLALTVNSNDPVTAAEIANYAAGIVVAKLGTASVSPEELLDAIK